MRLNLERLGLDRSKVYTARLVSIEAIAMEKLLRCYRRSRTIEGNARSRCPARLPYD